MARCACRAEEDEEVSGFEKWKDEEGGIPPLAYNPDIPIETFDFIVTDECHRSIYGLWRQVLEYFDASIVGLTATPSKHTLGFFNRNLVAEYPYERSVADGVNVGYEIYRIRTRVTEQGGKVEVGETGFQVPVRDKRTRQVRYEMLDVTSNTRRGAGSLGRQSEPDQNRASDLQGSRLHRALPGPHRRMAPDNAGVTAKRRQPRRSRSMVPFANLRRRQRLAKKITICLTGEDPKTLASPPRRPFARVAVTVDMIATGTDIKPVEVLIFMRDVKSEGYYEQMKGRGVRTIPDADLRAVTPDAKTKTRFVLIDAVGVSGEQEDASQPLERKHGVSFEALLEQLAMGRRDEDAPLPRRASRHALDRKLGEEDRARIVASTGGKSPRDLANDLLDAIDPDRQKAEIDARHGSTATPEQEKSVAEELCDKAARAFDKPETRCC